MLKIKVKISYVLAATLLIFVSVTVVWISAVRESAADQCTDYKWLNPRFICGHKAVIDKKEYVEFRSNLKSYIEEKKKEGKLIYAAVWFRDLEAGPTFGINERMGFVPASLLKLPLAMSLLQMAEDDPSILDRTIIYTEVSVPNQTFLPKDPLKKNTAYTISELIQHAIDYSDNAAAQLLYEYLISIEGNPLSQTYRDLGILEPGTDLNKAVITAKGYGSIFRLLYNVSFLNQESSEKLLAMLTRADFPEGLRSGVPKNIATAQKFGERFLENGEKQLHDCGIVYYPDNPYQICVLTRGSNFDDLTEIISEISKKVYEEVDSRRIQ